MKRKSGKTNPSTKRRREKRFQEYEGGGGVPQSTYENRSIHREEQGKRPFKIRFGPKGVSIQTKRGTYSHQKQIS